VKNMASSASIPLAKNNHFNGTRITITLLTKAA
jgi:hypothetical protein